MFLVRMKFRHSKCSAQFLCHASKSGEYSKSSIINLHNKSGSLKRNICRADPQGLTNHCRIKPVLSWSEPRYFDTAHIVSIFNSYSSALCVNNNSCSIRQGNFVCNIILYICHRISNRRFNCCICSFKKRNNIIPQGHNFIPVHSYYNGGIKAYRKCINVPCNQRSIR